MLVQADAAQLEWRSAVWLSNDQVGIDEINRKIDIHSTNEKAFVLPSRLIAKTYLFRTIFRGSGYAFARDPEFMHVSSDPKFWDDVNVKFYKKYYGLDRWHSELAQKCAERRPIVSPFGQEWLILPREKPILNKEGELIRTESYLPWTVFSNYPVQGSSAKLMAIARIALMRRMRAMGLKSLLVSTVHDSIVVDCPEDEVDAVVRLMHDVFNDLPKNVEKLFGIKLPIPFPCETKIGSSLKGMKKYGNPA